MRLKGSKCSEETKIKIGLSRIGRHYPLLSLAKKGKITWMKGKHHSEEAKKKLSEYRKGIPRTTSIWNKGKSYIELYGKEKAEQLINKHKMEISGEKHPNWMGGIDSITQQRIRKRSWFRLSKEIRKRDNNTCRRCGFQSINPPLSVHHIIPARISENDSHSNLLTVCKKCHGHLDHEYNRVGVTHYLKNYMLENIRLENLQKNESIIVLDKEEQLKI